MLSSDKRREERYMEHVWGIYTHPLFIKCVAAIEDAEKERIYCHHDMEHFLNVARIAYILSIEREYNLSKEEIYATALLHDLGRMQEYANGTPHHEASVENAKKILTEAGFDAHECMRICNAIRAHRTAIREIAGTEAQLLAEVIREADKLSRDCYRCKARDGCYWSDEKKNLKILW